jgi:hypothetical protein
MGKFKERIYHIDEFSNKEYAELLKLKTEEQLEKHQTFAPLVMVLYIATVVLLAIPFFLTVPGWLQSVISTISPIIYIGSFVCQVLIAHKMMILILGSAFSAGLDKNNPPFDMILGVLYCIIAVFTFIFCTPIAVSNQIKKDKMIIQAADKVLSAPDQIV